VADFRRNNQKQQVIFGDSDTLLRFSMAMEPSAQVLGSAYNTLAGEFTG
jgi:hypothetical protein